VYSCPGRCGYVSHAQVDDFFGINMMLSKLGRQLYGSERFWSDTAVVSKPPLLGPSVSVFSNDSAATSPPFAAGSGLHVFDSDGVAV